jgi:hypothetical protein
MIASIYVHKISQKTTFEVQSRLFIVCHPILQQINTFWLTTETIFFQTRLHSRADQDSLTGDNKTVSRNLFGALFFEITLRAEKKWGIFFSTVLMRRASILTRHLLRHWIWYPNQRHAANSLRTLRREKLQTSIKFKEHKRMWSLSFRSANIWKIEI